jgi:hypothetical protein
VNALRGRIDEVDDAAWADDPPSEEFADSRRNDGERWVKLFRSDGILFALGMMAYWTGTATSNRLQFEVNKRLQ